MVQVAGQEFLEFVGRIVNETLHGANETMASDYRRGDYLTVHHDHYKVRVLLLGAVLLLLRLLLCSLSFVAVSLFVSTLKTCVRKYMLGPSDAAGHTQCTSLRGRGAVVRPVCQYMSGLNNVFLRLLWHYAPMVPLGWMWWLLYMLISTSS